MANESSAVNDLISLVAGKPIATERGDDLLFRMPRAVKQAKTRARATPQPVAPVLPLMVLPAKASRPVEASAIPTLRTVKSVPAAIPTLRTVKAVRPAAAPTIAASAPAMSYARPASAPARNETTRAVHRSSFVGRLIFVVVLLGVGALSMATYLALMGSRTEPAAELAQPAATPPAPIEPSPVAAVVTNPVMLPAPAALAKPAQVAIRFDSKPAGATVVLVDNGVQSFLGTTPIEASVDPARTYEVVFALDGQPTKIASLDPKATTRLAIVLDAPAPAPAVVPAVARETAPSKISHRSKRAKLATAKPAATKAKPAAKQIATAELGVLMVSSKPPCSIIVDGKPTALTTPQRAISLTAGTHKITLINAQQNIKKTFSVQIKPQGSTKLIEDFLKTSARRSSSRR